MENPDHGTERHHVENSEHGTGRKMAEVHLAHCEKKNGHGTSRPLRKEKWPWYIAPIAKRKMAAVNHGKMAAVNHEKCASKVQPISNEKMC
jgi:hypothetical protein